MSLAKLTDPDDDEEPTKVVGTPPSSRSGVLERLESADKAKADAATPKPPQPPRRRAAEVDDSSRVMDIRSFAERVVSIEKAAAEKTALGSAATELSIALPEPAANDAEAPVDADAALDRMFPGMKRPPILVLAFAALLYFPFVIEAALRAVFGALLRAPRFLARCHDGLSAEWRRALRRARGRRAPR